ncbi:MAG: PAS domain S-box protein, partial [Bacteroidota bacterium]
HIQNAPRKKRDPWSYGVVKSWASVPILMKDMFSGVMILAGTKRETFMDKHLELMSAFASQIGVALENATLFERLRRSEERYMDLFENSPDMYHIVNRNGIIISCNQTEAERLGYRKDELIGHPIFKLYPGPYHEEARRLVKRMFERHREVKAIEEQMVTKNGELIDVSVNTSLIYDEAKKPVLMRVVARDITEKRKLEAKIIHAQRIDSIGNLAGGVAHDFNNILTSILGSTAIMKRKMKKEDPWYRFADIIEVAAKRGAALTRQLLTFARKSNVQFRPVIVNDIIEETLHLFERSIDKTITVRKDLDGDVAIINGDDGQLQQALLNLLINARDAMAEGGEVHVRAGRVSFDGVHTGAGSEERIGDFAAVTVQDTGIGMTREVQERIFEPFFTTKDQGKGTGLGLSVVYGVVNAHDGFITVDSEPGLGTTVSLYFPLLREAEGIRRSRRRTRLATGKERILVIDDEEHVGEVIGGMLQNLRYRVTIVRSGEEAIQLLRKKRKFDAVVLDMNMPRMGGKETFFRIKELDPDIRVIISTGYSNTSIESSPLVNSVDGFLQKPYQLEELSEMMREVFERRPQQSRT